MKFMVTWTRGAGTLASAAERFLAGQGSPAKGVTLVGRWHKVDLSGGFTLYESDNPAALYETAAVWADLMELHTTLVVEDAAVGPVLASVFKK